MLIYDALSTLPIHDTRRTLSPSFDRHSSPVLKPHQAKPAAARGS
jgi:hypothetical protein